MEPGPYWAYQTIEKSSLTELISSRPLQPLNQILETKRKAAREACLQSLRKDPEAEIIAIVGSVANGDIIGWFSDVDLVVITRKPRKEEMIEVGHQPLFIEYYDWVGFEDLLARRISRDEYEARSSYLFFYGNPYYLHSFREGRARYERTVTLGIQALWNDYSKIEEYLDDFVWFYGSAKEALRRNQTLTAMGKLQRGATLLLRYYLIKNKILLRKPLPDERTIIQLRNSEVPKELVDFTEQLYRGRLEVEMLLQRSREIYLLITNGRKWMNEIPV